MLAPNFARIDAERLENEICPIRRGPLGRAAELEIAARHGPRCVLSSHLVIYAHGDSRMRSISLATTLEPAKPCPGAWTKPSQPNLAILTAGRAPARTHARDLVSNRAVWRLSPPQPSKARRAAWCANCSVLVGRSSFLALCAVKRPPSSAARRCRVCGETRKRFPTRARPCDARGASGLRTARGLRALLGGPRSAFGVSSVSPRSARVLPPSFTCLRRGRRTASSHTARTRAVSCRELPWAPERRLLRIAEFHNTSGFPRLLAKFHDFFVNSTLFRDFQLLSPISTRHQAKFANCNLKREFHVVWRRVVLVMWGVLSAVRFPDPAPQRRTAAARSLYRSWS